MRFLLRHNIGKWYRRIAFLVVLVAVFYLPVVPFRIAEADPSVPGVINNLIRQVKKEIPPLDLSKKPNPSPATVSFFQYYDIYYEHLPHYFGKFYSDEYSIAAHIFAPLKAHGTVFLLHGYFDHTGILKNLIRYCLDGGLAVACFDLPGHGFSSGHPGAIADFYQYVSVLENFTEICSLRLPEPYYLIGHSLGGAIALEYIFNGNSQGPGFKKIILLAPLIHYSYYQISRLQYPLLKSFVENIPRGTPGNSSDPVFVDWLRQDPLQGRQIPIDWLHALYEWNDRMENYGPVSTPLLVIQGTRDSVVDWRYNIKLLQEKCNFLTVKWIEKGRHQLLNESRHLREEVLLAISSYLGNDVQP